NLNAYSAIYAGNSTENDVDKVRINNVSVGDNCFLTVWLGGGDDELYMTNVWVQGDIDIYAEGGNDKVELRTVTAVDELMASLGEGSDTLLLDDVHANTIRLTGEGG